MKRTTLFCILALATIILCSAGAQQPHSLRAMVWNVENLFDTCHDEGFDDHEFLPQAQRRWTRSRYWRKLNEVAKVVAAVGEDRLPDLIGLCEVENDSVLRDLTQRSALRTLRYEYVMTHSMDARGIDVALLYQPVRFRLVRTLSHRVPSSAHGLRPTRDILQADGLFKTKMGGVKMLSVFVVHLPSRTSGASGDRNRRVAASVLWTHVDSLLAVNPQACIVVMGDFNASASDEVFRHSPLRITDNRKEPGTYSYQGRWEWLDHVLVSPAIEVNGTAHAVRLPWLLETNKTYGTDMPRRTFKGPTYHGGVSDHLPVVIDMNLP